MMRRRSLWLTLIALIVIGALLLIMRSPTNAKNADNGAKLLPGFEEQLNDITKIRIVSNGQEIDLSRGIDAQHWQVEQMGNYPADLGRLRDFITGLARSRRMEAMTAKPENYGKLGLDDRAVIQVVISAGEKTAADLMIGKPAENSHQTFVRLPDNPQVWLCSGALRPYTTPLEWLRQEVLDIHPERIAKVTIHHLSGVDVVVSRPDAKAPIEITPKPPENNPPLTYQVQSTLHAIAHLQMTQVTSQASLTASEPDMATFATFDGLTVNLRFSANKFGEWVTLDAFAADTAAPAVKAEAEAINQRSKGWAYQFAPYVMTQLKLSADKLTKYSGPMRVQ